MKDRESVELLRSMMLIRQVEERIADRYADQEMRCPVHLCIGQEAVPAGVCAHLTTDDYVLSSHRSHGHYLAKGGDLNAMIAEIYGKMTGCSRGKGGSMHLIDLDSGFLGATPIVGSTIPIAVGAAFGSILAGEQRVTVCFFGDGTIEEGVVHESFNFAALKGLPVVFVCENNLYSVYSPLGVRQPPAREIYQLAEAHGIASVQGDGNDVETVYRLAGEAIGRARDGGGPSFLEFKTYRWREHCGPEFDNQLGYRSEREYLEWRRRCPVEQHVRKLIERGVLTDDDVEGVKAEISAAIDAAFDFALASDYPPGSELMENVYA